MDEPEKSVEHFKINISYLSKEDEERLLEWLRGNPVELIELAANPIELKVTTTKDLEQQQAEIELLEKQSALEKRLRKYKRSDPAETWCSRWVASPIAYLFPKKTREEWLGDLYEVNREMLHKGFPRWQVNLNNVVKTAILVVSSLQIKLSDFISSTIGRRS